MASFVKPVPMYIGRVEYWRTILFGSVSNTRRIERSVPISSTTLSYKVSHQVL
jgi:hypothetical protein